MGSESKGVPAGFQAVTPHLAIKGAREAIEFYKKAFGAEEVFSMPMPDGRVGHAEIRINGGMMMIADEFQEYGAGPVSPKTLGGTTATIHLYFPDVDAAWARAVGAGAEVVMPLADMFWGDRYGRLRDPFGHDWSLAQHVKDVTPEEMQAAMAAMMSGDGACK